jgi:cell wall-associated NlpC family hydrolase
MRRLALLPLIVLTVVQAASAAKAPTSWAQPQIKIVTAHGLMGGDPQPTTFRPDDPLTQGDLAGVVAGLTEQPLVTPANPSATVTIAQLDAKLLNGLGLADSAAGFARAARAAGLRPPARFGAEVVARLLALRTNHPAAQDALELRPNDVATRAEAAFSAARVLQLSGREQDALEEQSATFEPPALTLWQTRILQTAVGFIGFPYVWGGESEVPTTAASPFGLQVQGGFDCSGFVWRVYKLQPYAGAPQLAQTLSGRTTMVMSGEVPKAHRIAAPDLQPADVLFFGAHGPRSKPAEIDHAAIYLGNGWLIQSSTYGVALAPFDGWYARRFAWARRPLAEAHLA